MYDTILVPTDGSEHAARAAVQAEYVAGLFDADLHLMSVVDVDAEAGPFSAGGIADEFLDELRAEARESIRETQSHLDVDAETAVATGRPSEAILTYVDEEGIDLVSMGTHGRTGVRRTVVGSVAERVVSHADVPVLTARATEERAVDAAVDYGEILVPTDAMGTVEPAVDHALEVAERTGARIHALHAVHVSATAGAGLSTPSTVLSALSSAGEEATERVADRAREAGLSAVTEVREGTPAETVVSYADEQDVDLLAMGTAGRTGLSRFLLGSTTEQVIRHAGRPVLAVNARQ